VCLQEVNRTPYASPQWLYWDKDLERPQRANLFEELERHLPNHLAVFSPVGRGRLLDAERNEYVCEDGLATFVRRTLSIVRQTVNFIHGCYRPQGWGEKPKPRNIHVLELYDQSAGTFTTIAQLHGLWDPRGKVDTPERTAQAHSILGTIEAFGPTQDRLIICGDFNVLPEGTFFKILSQLNTINLVSTHGIADTRTSYYKKDIRLADYILASPAIQVTDFRAVEEPEVSDHRALLLEFC
jgi:endonuclease/exonuclease/phosphatase family metal-dependent hydrolase